MNAKLRTFDDYPRTFKVNEFITLKLERNRTNIYVKDELFQQCKYVLLTIPVDKVSTLDETKSVDEAAEFLNHSQEPQNNNVASQITPKVEFWAHSSNMQAWAENDYDTRLIHRNLAFPLLRKLVEAGDPKAKKVFKEEIAKRLESNYPPVVEYLKQEGYLDYLSREEQILIVLEPEEAEALLTIKHKYEVEFELLKKIDLEYGAPPRARWYVGISNKNVIVLELDYVNIDWIIGDILKFSNLQSIGFADENMVTLPDEMRKLDSLTEFAVYAPNLEKIPGWLLDFKNLKLFVVGGVFLKRKALEIVKKMEEKGVYVDFLKSTTQ